MLSLQNMVTIGIQAIRPYDVLSTLSRKKVILLGCGSFNKEHSGKQNRQAGDDVRTGRVAKAMDRQDEHGIHQTGPELARPSAKRQGAGPTDWALRLLTHTPRSPQSSIFIAVCLSWKMDKTLNKSQLLIA